MYKLMVILALSMAVVFGLVGCGDDDDTNNDMDASTDTDTDSDTDTDTDTDSDSDGDVGDVCAASYNGMMNFGGTCAAAEGDCTAGTVPGDTQGDCNEGLTCCLSEDSCEVDGAGMAACQADECALGLQAGCPSGGWCCITVDQDAGPGTQDAGQACTSALDFGPAAISMSGVCQAQGSACEGGYMPGMEQGNCLASLNLHCCIDTDQCEETTGGMAGCQADACSMGAQVGCPSNGYCCVGAK